MGRSKKSAVVCATTGIMGTCSSRSELEGVMAHELSHVKNRDVLIMTMAGFFATIASMIMQFGFFFGGGRQGDDDDNPSFLVVLLVSDARLRAVVLPDARAVALPRVHRRPRCRDHHRPPERPGVGAAEDLVGQLARVPSQDLREAGVRSMNAFFIIPASAKNAVTGLFSTHPPVEKRIARLAAVRDRAPGQCAGRVRPLACDFLWVS